MNKVAGANYEQPTLVYYDGDKRVRRRFSNWNDAKREAELVATKLANGEHEVLKLTVRPRRLSTGHRPPRPTTEYRVINTLRSRSCRQIHLSKKPSRANYLKGGFCKGEQVRAQHGEWTITLDTYG